MSPKLLVVQCRSGTEVVELRKFVDNTQGLKWVRVYSRAETKYYDKERGFTQVVVACVSEQAEFKLQLCFNVVRRTPV